MGKSKTTDETLRASVPVSEEAMSDPVGERFIAGLSGGHVAGPAEQVPVPEEDIDAVILARRLLEGWNRLVADRDALVEALSDCTGLLWQFAATEEGADAADGHVAAYRALLAKMKAVTPELPPPSSPEGA